eukprot:CAMPEP_0171716382 /NCGR_PEP_ID=MMETSP0991-20121206/19425_1 /TAXON_ID=483369 /ORGANISM="non described non described, Strain CCMP2098" /LENGTH=475 /DNA_ID=CAMNT_0012307439 /DNA_START=962 /DNA_END=2389 /DNA_ORIENTATION=+
MRHLRKAAFPPTGKGKQRTVSPWAVCVILSVVTGGVHFIAVGLPALLQPHPWATHPWEIDPLQGLATEQERHRRLTEKEGAGKTTASTVPPIADVLTMTQEAGRPSWLRQLTQLNYAQQQHKAAAAARQANDGTRNVWDLFEGIWQCDTVQRLGKVGDGGKWVCDPHRFGNSKHERSSADNSKGGCVVYSFGSAGEPSFELDAHDTLGCEVHSFDPTLERSTVDSLLRAASNGTTGTAKFTFHPWGLKAAEGGGAPAAAARGNHRKGKGGGALKQESGESSYKSLRWIMAELGHSFVDILKVDIEGSEWSVFNSDLLCAASTARAPRPRSSSHLGSAGELADPTARTRALPRLPFDQVLIELHWSGSEGRSGEADLFSFMRGMHAFGFKAFHREPNVADVQRCWEYSFVRPEEPSASTTATATPAHSLRSGADSGGSGTREGEDESRGDLESFLADCKATAEIRHRNAVEWQRSL